MCEVMELTELTKKAISYYEEQELIKPEINPVNNYREYSQEDIDKLIQIATLRQFDISIKEIKEILNSPEMFKEKLEQHLTKIDSEMERLEKNKSVLKSCLTNFNNPESDMKQLTKQLSVLNKALEMDEKSREGFMERQLQRIFPGRFGKVIIAQFSVFLNDPIDTKEKEEAWLDLVKFLDEVESISYSEDMQLMYDKLTDEDMEKVGENLSENAKKWISITEEELKEERRRILETIAKANNDNPQWKKLFTINKGLKEQMKSIGYYDKFTENLKILSNDYKRYLQNRNEFYKSLNIKIDEEGRVLTGERPTIF
ncbi:MAG: MerR family transcriptional regulator [Clostridiaceae bacterium]